VKPHSQNIVQGDQIGAMMVAACFMLGGSLSGPVYTWRTLTGVKLNNNWPQYSI